MECDDCGSEVHFSLAEYLDRKERLGVVLCYQCRRGDAVRVHVSAPL